MMQFKNLMEQNYNIKYEFYFESCVHPKLKKVLSNLLNLEQQVYLEKILHTIQKRDPIINNATLLQPLYNTLKMKMINQNYFQQQILYFMVTKFQPEYLEVLQRIFNNFDSDKDGILSIQDFQRMYQQIIDDLNLDLVINDVFSKIDASNQGEIKFKEFILASINIEEILQNNHIEATFRYLQKNNQYIDFDKDQINQFLMDTYGYTKINNKTFEQILMSLL